MIQLQNSSCGEYFERYELNPCESEMNGGVIDINYLHKTTIQVPPNLDIDPNEHRIYLNEATKAGQLANLKQIFPALPKSMELLETILPVIPSSHINAEYLKNASELSCYQ